MQRARALARRAPHGRGGSGSATAASLRAPAPETSSGDLGIERAVIAGADAIEAARAVGDHAGEHVEPAGRAFRIGGGGDIGRQREAFEQRHDVDAAGFQHRAVGERDLVQLQFVDALGDRGVAAAGSSRARDRRPRRAAGRGSPAGSGRARTSRAGRIPPAFASAAIMRSGRMPSSVSGKRKRHDRSSMTAGRSNRMAVLDGKASARVMSLVIPWSFEPAGLPPR